MRCFSSCDEDIDKALSVGRGGGGAVGGFGIQRSLSIRDKLTNIILQNDDSQFLYVILPYFNYCGSKARLKLFMNFIKRYAGCAGVRICIVEARLKGANFELPKSFPKIYKHIGVTTSDCIWIKESLINIMVSSLPDNWKYIAWIDADISFLNARWVSDTIQKLQNIDVVQLFQTCVNMGPSGEAFKIDKSFGYMHIESGHEWSKEHRYGFWHSGYAWACTRHAYLSIGKLIDYGILGAGDHHMALALIGKVTLSHPGTIHPNYKAALLKFQERCLKNKLTLGYIGGTIIHHWHGSLKDRKYQERWNILIKEKYDPDADIHYTHEGYVQLTGAGKRFAPLLEKYFSERNEDNRQIVL
jgi:hypothetical protein